MVAKIISYRDLKVWQEGRKLAVLVYLQLRTFPKYEQFGLSDQMRRAVVSVPSNIAEGFGRATAKEKNQFYYVAKGSLAELETQLYIAFDIGYIDEKNLDDILEQSSLTHRLLQGLIKANKERL
ncbi:MAG: four helix bundle protein [Candidatus Saccharibacteria bacterium]